MRKIANIKKIDIKKTKLIPDININNAHEKTISNVWPISGWIIRSREIKEIKTAVLWKKKISTFEPDYCAQKLDSNPWIVQPFENYEEVRVEDLIKKHQGS